MADLTDDDVARRRSAKRFNERLKLAATFLNTTGIAAMVGTLVIPAFQDFARVSVSQWASIPGAAALHLGAQALMTLFRSED